jgi:uncharacterized protein involved in exopolysaccharide biosynthesis
VTSDEFDPVEYLTLSWWSVIFVIVLFAVLGAAGSALLPPVYRSSATLLYSTSDPSAALTGLSTSSSDVELDRAVNNQRSIVTSDAVIGLVAERAGMSAKALRRSATVTTEDSSNVIEIEVEADTARSAQRLATDLAETYVQYDQRQGAEALQSQADSLDASIEALTSRLASLPTGGSNSLRRAQRTALVNEVEALTRQQGQIEAAARSFPGQVTTLSAAELPQRNRIVEMVKGAIVGGAIGFVLGILWAVLRGRHRIRRRAQRRTEQQLSQSVPGRRRETTSA